MKRNKKPQLGRALRLVPSRRTKDGTFLNGMVDSGLLARVTGTTGAPFEATFSLTPLGEHAAEFGECDFPMRAKAAAQPQPAKKSKGATRGSA